MVVSIMFVFADFTATPTALVRAANEQMNNLTLPLSQIIAQWYCLDDDKTEEEEDEELSFEN